MVNEMLIGFWFIAFDLEVRGRPRYINDYSTIEAELEVKSGQCVEPMAFNGYKTGRPVSRRPGPGIAS